MEHHIHIFYTKVTLIRTTFLHDKVLKSVEILTSLLSSLKYGVYRGPRKEGVVLDKCSLSSSGVTFPKTG